MVVNRLVCNCQVENLDCAREAVQAMNNYQIEDKDGGSSFVLSVSYSRAR